MAITWKFWGASDDLAYFARNGDVDEGSPGTFKLSNPEGEGLLITVAYAQGELNQGTWMVGVAQVDEGHDLPSWPVELGKSGDCDYSVELTITTPDGVNLEGFDNGMGA